jgi:hypothetical protein
MYARGIGGRMSGRRQAQQAVLPSTAATPLTIFTSGGAPVLWVRGDLGMNGSTTITSWNDQSAGGHNLIPDVTAPAIASADATLGSLPTVHAVASTGLTTVLARAAPYSYRSCLKIHTWNTAGAGVMGDTNLVNGLVATAGVANNVYMAPAFVNNINVALDTWYRLRADFIPSTSDLLRMGALVGTGSSSATGALVNFGINCSGGIPGLNDISVWEIVVLPYTPTPAEDIAYDAYLSSKTGGIPLF